MLPAALAWLRTAQECFDDEEGSLTSGLLTSVAMLVVGLERVFHLEEMEDMRLRPIVGRESSSLALHGGSLATTHPLAGGRRLLSPNQPLGIDSRPRRLAEPRRTYRSPLDEDVLDPQRLHHHT